MHTRKTMGFKFYLDFAQRSPRQFRAKRAVELNIVPRSRNPIDLVWFEPKGSASIPDFD